MSKLRDTKVTFTQSVLTVLFVCCLLISNVITAKQMLLPCNITMTCAVIIFPITYILSDVFSEVYGYKWSRITCYLGFAMNLLMVIAFEIAISTKAPSYWTNQEAFQTVLGSAPRVLGASLAAFIVGDFVNDKVFAFMKSKREEGKGFGSRAIISSLLGEIVDSSIFLPIAFIGQMPGKTLIQLGVCQVLIKVLYEVIMLPCTSIVVNKIRKVENNG